MSDRNLSALTDAELEQLSQLTKRQEKILTARDSFVDFMEYTMPDDEDPDDINTTLYQRTPHALLFCDLVEKMESGKERRTCVSIPPQHGKTIHISIRGAAWIAARNPKAKIIIASYNQDRAEELGTDVRALFKTSQFKQVFPEYNLDPGSQSKSFIRNLKGGSITFSGARSAITGKTADFFIIDDPYKGEDEEFTDTALESIWKWFYSVVYSRGSKKTRNFVVHTRWHEDDLIGRLCDPEHPDREKRFAGIAEDWFYLNIPGVITDKRISDMLGLDLEMPLERPVIEQFGMKPMVALWEKERDLEFFARWKRGDERTFSALVMGRPSPDDGLFFKAEWIEEYEPDELPQDLRIYAASDHAVSERQQRDFNVLGRVGIDVNDTIWIMPDLVMERMETDRVVEEIIRLMRIYPKPMNWFMESELISKSFGPFLRKRMRETKTYVAVTPVMPSKDKRTRAQSIRGRMANGKVKFPRRAPWWSAAKGQLLRFPYAAHDDFVDFISTIGNAMDIEIAANAPRVSNDNVVQPGTIEWVVQRSEQRKFEEKIRSRGGW